MRIERAMKISAVIAVAATVLAGCRRSEAELFGYRGRDVKSDERGETTFFTTVPTVTNTLPLRVLSVQEKYELSEGEKALVKAAQIVMPSVSLKTIPAGYAKKFDEPWFVTWSKPAKAFGVDGFCGFVSHFDEEAGEWLTGESYFTSHWPTKEKALALLSSLEKDFIGKYGALKIHKFSECYAVEYRRLRVICVVGMLPDSKWACMLSVQDKNNYGCGQIEPVEVQREMLARYKYDKAMKAWAEKVDGLSRLNREKIAAACAAKGIDRAFGDAKWMKSGDVLHVLCANGSARTSVSNLSTAAECALAFDAEWKKLTERAAKAFGIPDGSAFNEEKFASGAARSIVASNELFDVRIEMYCPCAKLAANGQTSSGIPEEEAKPGEKETQPEKEIVCEWNVVATEKIQPGVTVPEKPKAPNFSR